MKIKDIALSAAAIGGKVVKAIAIGAVEVWSAVKYLIFKDNAVEQICVANFSSDGVGVTEEDAAKVTSIGMIFRGNTEITSFDELVEFENVKTINDSYAFEKCTSLRSIDLSNINEMNSRTFSDCTALESIGSLENLKKASNAIFYKCTSLGGDVSLPSYEGSIGWGVYTNTNIQRVANLGNTTSIGVGAGGSDNGAFSNCKNLRTVVFPDTIEEIGPYCFYGDINLTQVFNIEKVKKLRTHAFSVCSSLVYDELSFEDLEVFDDNALANNSLLGVNVKRITNLGKITYFGKVCVTSLEMIRLPSTVTSCANYALASCSALTTLIIEATSPFPISQYLLNGTPIKSGKGTIYVPDESVEAYKTASNWSTYADSIEPMSKYVES